MTRIIGAAAAAALLAAAAFPAQVEVWNNTWREHVEPETKATMAPYSAAMVTVVDADQLARVQSNLETLNLVNAWPEPAGLFLRIPEDVSQEAAAASDETGAPPPGGGTAPAEGAATTTDAGTSAGPAEPAAADAATAPKAAANKATAKK